MSLTKVTYSMIEGATASVLDFGAVGDGVTNDTLAIQAAIDSNASRIFFPDGDYLLTGQTTGVLGEEICVEVPAGKTLFGPGRIICNRKVTPTVIMFAVNASNVTFDGLTIDNIAVPSGGESSRSIAIQTGNRSLPNNDAVISDLQVMNCKLLNHFYGFNIAADDTSPNTVREVLFTNNYVVAHPDGVFSGAAQFRDYSFQGKVTDVVISGNTVKNATNSAGLNIYNVYGFTVVNNQAIDCDFAGIEMENNCQSGTVTGNFVNRCGRGIWVDDSKDIVVSSNTIIGEERTPPTGGVVREGIFVTRQGITTDTGYVTTGIVITNNIVLDTRIRTATIGTSPLGAFGTFLIQNNFVKFRDATDMQGTGVLVSAGVVDLNLSGNTVIGGSNHSISVGVVSGGAYTIANNITKKAGSESSFGLLIAGDAGANVVRLGNQFEQGVDAATGTKVLAFEYYDATTDSPPLRWNSVAIEVGNGSPEGVISRGPGSLFLDRDAPAKVYLKSTGFADTGWVNIT